MLPFVPNGRQNMISWLGARSDVPDYGKSLNYIFSKSSTVFGPSQVEATINQDPDISAQRTLWGQQGSQVIMGNLLVVPIEDSLLYVQPLYLQSDADPAAAAQARDRLLPRAGPAPAARATPSRSWPWSPRSREALTAAFGQSFLPGNASGGTGPERHRRRRDGRRTTGGGDGHGERPGARAHRARQHASSTPPRRPSRPATSPSTAARSRRCSRRSRTCSASSCSSRQAPLDGCSRAASRRLFAPRADSCRLLLSLAPASGAPSDGRSSDA